MRTTKHMHKLEGWRYTVVAIIADIPPKSQMVKVCPSKLEDMLPTLEHVQALILPFGVEREYQRQFFHRFATYATVGQIRYSAQEIQELLQTLYALGRLSTASRGCFE